jgi:hypothetical protein
MNENVFRTAVLVTLAGIVALVPGVMFLTSAAEAHSRHVQLTHPCDIDRSGYRNGTLEILCLEIWAQDAYTTRVPGGQTETPAGPVVVSEFMSEWQAEFPHPPQGQEYLANGLRNIQEDYSHRDR